jgi:manganese-dependent inorganic pyrophosphatase
MPVYVIGHKNPDTDAICAAIGYAELLRKTTTPDAEAVACGTANERTEYALEKAGIPHPRLLMDARPTAGQLCQRNVLYGRHDEPFLEIYRRMQKNGIRNLPILNADNKIIGMLPLLNLLQLLIPDREDLGEHRKVNTSLSRMRNVLQGTFQHQVKSNNDETLSIIIGAMSADAFTEHLHKFPAESALVVAGDRPTVQKPAIDYGVRCIVVTGGYKMSDRLLEEAIEKKISVICTPYDTAMTSLLIRSSRLIHQAIDTDFIFIPENMPLEEIRKLVSGTHQDLFPVIDGDEKLVGVFSKTDLINPEPIKLILVDHNEYGQAVKGAVEADILEVIDHHRIGGGLVSREPIRFFNDPVGSTSTIIARMFREQAVIPEPSIALCLAAGIISDTLHLQSPTTTDTDHDILAWLESYAQVDMTEFTQEFFASGSALHSHTAEEIINSDCKAYMEGDWKITVSQAEELGLAKFWERKGELTEALKSHLREKQLDFACLMITDITKQSSILLTVGEQRIIDTIEFPEPEKNLFKLAGVVSRKKQLLPQLMWILGKVPKTI